MEIRKVFTDSAPAPIGPYSQAIVAQGFVYTAGQIPLDPATKSIVQGDIQSQTLQALKNVDAVLRAAGASMKTVVKMTVFLKDMNEFARMNEVYSTFLGESAPARSTVEVSRLPRDVKVEIEAIAVVG